MRAGWEQAYTRAGQIAAAASPLGADERSWEFVAVRGILAVALQSLGEQSGDGPLTVRLGSVLWHLARSDTGVRGLAEPLVGPQLAAAIAPGPTPEIYRGDAVTETWLWLTRPGPAPSGNGVESRRWGGMTRGLARGSTEPAVTVARDLTIDVVHHALEKERTGLPNGTVIQVVGDVYDGRRGTVLGAAWKLDDRRRDIEHSDLPSGYEVRLSAVGTDESVDVVLRPSMTQAVLDEAAWEQGHQDAYREGSWPRVQRLAWALTKYRIGYDPADLSRAERPEDPEETRRRREVWMPASTLLALALWRAARFEALLVDEVPLPRALWWLGGGLHAGLYDEPLPEWSPALVGGWARVQQSGDKLMYSARSIVERNMVSVVYANRLEETADGSLLPPVLLGDRCRALAAAPYRDGQPPRWAEEVEYAGRAVAEASECWRAGTWTPGEAVAAVAAVLYPTLRAEPDAPEMPEGVEGPAWIQRVVHLVHVHTTISTVQHHHQGDAELSPHPRHRFGLALGLAHNALDNICPAGRELESLWAGRQVGVASWERTRVPVAVREHIIALEDLVHDLCLLCFEVSGLPGEEV
ncbi:hypothetical protein ACFU99_06870 [Streptomyces sp. NPDC057654]|uniref:hypothetical protein n=1 Tax=Streptomyces sp. NPDC057654 TaxID=3346196 RepID=UPI0036AB7757